MGKERTSPKSMIMRTRRDMVRAASLGATVTYGHLMKKFRLSRGRPLSKLIGELDAAEYSKGAPGFAAIIVRKDTGLPGGGYFCDDRLPAILRRSSRRATDPRLSPVEITRVREEQRRIWAFYRAGS